MIERPNRDPDAQLYVLPPPGWKEKRDGLHCDRIGCDETGLARFWLLIYVVGHPEPSLMNTDMNVCPGHAETVIVADVVTDDIWRMLRMGFAFGGMPEPVRETVELVAVPRNG